MWSVNKLERAATKWTRACYRRLARLISYIQNTNGYRQYCHVGNTTEHFELGLFQDCDFSGDLEDPTSTSGSLLYVFGSQMIVPVSWICKKQSAVPHSSTETEVTSCDGGFAYGRYHRH